MSKKKVIYKLRQGHYSDGTNDYMSLSDIPKEKLERSIIKNIGEAPGGHRAINLSNTFKKSKNI